jgi:hypothetical protein
MAQSCAICCEEQPFGAWWQRRKCCIRKRSRENQESALASGDVLVCPSCLFNHVKSILNENGGAGGGRASVQCPLGCGYAMTDVEIRSIIQREYFSFWKHFIVRDILQTEEFLSQTMLVLMGTLLCICQTKYYKQVQSSLHQRFFALRQHFTVTEEERQELRRYEMWSVRTAIATRSNEEKEREELICCPAPDCINMWFTSVPYRRYKQVNEESSSESSSEHHHAHCGQPARANDDQAGGSFRQRMTQKLLSMAHHIMYKPPPSANEVDFMGGEEAKLNFLFWVDGYDLQGSRMHHTPSKDGRKLICSMCSAEFCGLCRKPWMALKIPRHLRGSHSNQVSLLAALGAHSTGNNGGPQRTSHEGKSCEAFGAKAATREDEDEADEYAFIAAALQARYCPGCSMRTQRAEGCNHMTCPCGMEWCYVCECRWATFHYGCAIRTDENGNELPNENVNTAGGCVIL